MGGFQSAPNIEEANHDAIRRPGLLPSAGEVKDILEHLFVSVAAAGNCLGSRSQFHFDGIHDVDREEGAAAMLRLTQQPRHSRVTPPWASTAWSATT